MWRTRTKWRSDTLLVSTSAALLACSPDVGSGPTAATSPDTAPQANATTDLLPYAGYAYRAREGLEIYDELQASSQVDDPDDGVRYRCPEEPIHRSITMNIPVGIELPRFEFRGSKPFVGYTNTWSTYPEAEDRHLRDEISDDARWIARANGKITLRCRGRYIRTGNFRVWTGTYWPLAHEGEIRAGPSYAGPVNGCEDYRAVRYDPDPSDCENTGGGGGDHGTGPSCSGAVRYEPICIDVWDGSQWVTWWCGTAVTCAS